MVIVGSIFVQKTFIQDAESWATIPLINAAEHLNTLANAKNFEVPLVDVNVHWTRIAAAAIWKRRSWDARRTRESPEEPVGSATSDSRLR